MKRCFLYRYYSILCRRWLLLTLFLGVIVFVSLLSLPHASALSSGRASTSVLPGYSIVRLDASPTLGASATPTSETQVQQLYTVAQNDITVANSFVTVASVVLSIVAVLVAVAGVLEIVGRRQIESRIQHITQLEQRLEQQEQRLVQQIETRSQQFTMLEQRIERQIVQLEQYTAQETRAFTDRFAQLDKHIADEQSAFEKRLRELNQRFESENKQFMEASYNFSMGKAAYLSSDDQHAIEYFLEALKRQPENPGILERLGRSYSNLNDMTNAILYLEKALSVDPDYIPALRSLALCHRYSDPEKAIECLQHALAINPAGYEALDFLGLILRDLGRIDEAISKHEKALTFQRRPETEFYLSILYALKGDIKGAKVRALSAEYDIHKPEHDQRMRPIWKSLIQSAIPIIDGDKEAALHLIRNARHEIKSQRIYESLKDHLQFLLKAHLHTDWLQEFMELIQVRA